MQGQLNGRGDYRGRKTRVPPTLTTRVKRRRARWSRNKITIPNKYEGNCDLKPCELQPWGSSHDALIEAKSQRKEPGQAYGREYDLMAQ